VEVAIEEAAMTSAIGQLYGADAKTRLGTAFAINADLAVTAFHCVGDRRTGDITHRDVQIWFSRRDGEQALATVSADASDHTADFAVLRLLSPLPAGFEPLGLVQSVRIDVPFRSIGYPAALADQVERAAISGRITDSTAVWKEQPVLQLFCEQAGAGLPLKGYSGAPVLVRDRQQEAAAGLIRWNPRRYGELVSVGGMVFACPIRSVVGSPGLEPFRAQLNLVAHSGAAASGGLAPPPSPAGLAGRSQLLGVAPSGAAASAWLAPPPGPAGLIGRNQLLASLRERLQSRWPVALHGLPGVGKTALALGLANDPELRYHFPDGVLWASIGFEGADARAHLERWADAVDVPPGLVADDNDRLIGHINRAIGSRHILVVVDDVWDPRIAQALRVGGANCAHLCTTRRIDVAREFTSPAGHTEPVATLETAAALDLLYDRAPDARNEPRAALALVESVDGLPLAISVLGHAIRQVSGQPRRVRETLDKLRDATARLELEAPPDLPVGVRAPISLRAAIEVSETALEEPSRRTLSVLSIFRAKPVRFPEAVAVAVTGGSVDDLDALVDAGLIEAAGDDTYTMHQTIDDYASRGLSLEETVVLHLRAADAFGDSMRAVEEERQSASAFQRAYRFEEGDWIEAAAAWLYHVAQSPRRSEAGLALAKHYLDEFWWWGMYDEEFGFCTRLLDEWERTQRAPEDREWLGALRRLGDSYPIGHERGAGEPTPRAWAAVGGALDDLWRLGGLDRPLPELTDQQRHVRAIGNFFRSESCRYGPRDDEAADRCLLETLALVEDSEADRWNVPYVHSRRADLALARGQFELAEELCRATVAAAHADSEDPKDLDHEVIAYAHRVRADCLAREGAVDAAAAQYACATLHSFACLGWPKPPDTYTLKYYREMCQRATAWTEQLGEGSSAEPLRVRVAFRRFWAPYWEIAGEPASADLRLFPPEPSPKELRSVSYAEKRTRMLLHMLDRGTCDE
jgi:hypothetical protein